MTGQRPDYDVLMETGETAHDGTPMSMLKLGVGFIHRTGYDRQRLGVNCLFKNGVAEDGSQLVLVREDGEEIAITKIVLLAPRNKPATVQPQPRSGENIAQSVIDSLRGNGVF